MEYAQESFTGIRPTNNLTIANYMGAVMPLELARNDGRIGSLFIAELHAATTDPPKEIVANSLKVARTVMAGGFSGNIFQQLEIEDLVSSAVIALSGHVNVARMLRLPTLKEKVRDPQNVEAANVSLFMYPLMMAADITLARPKTIPTGRDQLPHIEVAREIIRSFNGLHSAKIPLPQATQIDPPNIMSLDGLGKKMSKSAPKGAIFLDDNPSAAVLKINKAVTASEVGEDLNRSVDNLGLIGTTLTEDTELVKSITELGSRAKNGEKVLGQFKAVVAESVHGFLTTHQKAAGEITDADVRDRLMKGLSYARPIAQETLKYIHDVQWGHVSNIEYSRPRLYK